MGGDMPTIKANGIEINYRIDGAEGAPWLTFSNSLACDLPLWDGQLAAVEADYRVLRYDTRGHGASEAPAGDYSFDDLIGDVVGLWDALGIARSSFVGLSLGAMTGLGLALDHADRLSKAVICDCRADAPKFFIDMWIERRALLTERGMEGVVEDNIERWFSPGFRAGGSPLLDQVRAMIRRTSQAGFMGCTAALMALDFLPRLGEITVPISFVVGALDGHHPEEMAKMQGLVAGSGITVIEDAAHLPNIEQPAAFTAALVACLAD